ncbi:MAG: LamG-like jellyroll fold domain-containing protein, partial [Rhodospirillales bacterium]|nr:LamG-like jellyroll fold domain-containing protein [Rhodospirillales bacterium]
MSATLPGLAGETVLSFTGSDSYVNLGTPDALQIPSSGPFTVEGWMYLNALDSRDMLYTKNSARSSSVISYTLGFYDTGDLGAYSASSGWVKCVPDTNIATKRWYHAAFSYDGTNMSYYLDGQPFGSKPYTFANTESHTVKIGGYY